MIRELGFDMKQEGRSMICGECGHWWTLEATEYGECRFNPPVLVHYDNGPYSKTENKYPILWRYQSCGRFTLFSENDRLDREIEEIRLLIGHLEDNPNWTTIPFDKIKAEEWRRALNKERRKLKRLIKKRTTTRR